MTLTLNFSLVQREAYYYFNNYLFLPPNQFYGMNILIV